jgi:antitoxin HigA-1
MLHNVYGRKGERIETDLILHPGEVLLDEIETRNLKKLEVALALEILPGHLSEIFKGKRNITATTALKLEQVLNISAEFWMGLQSDFDLSKARKKFKSKQKSVYKTRKAI